MTDMNFPILVHPSFVIITIHLICLSDSGDLKMSIARVFHDEEFVKSRQTEEKMCVD